MLANRAHLAIVFLLSAVGGGLLSLIFAPSVISVGASGGIVGLIGYLAIYAFRRRQFISSAFRKNLLINIGFIIIFGLALYNVIDNFGHIGGLLTGAVYRPDTDPIGSARRSARSRFHDGGRGHWPRWAFISLPVFLVFCWSSASFDDLTGMPRVRVHQHVNPLSPYYTAPPEPVDLEEVFADPTLPLHLDIGCARGRFILRMALAEAGWNFLGVEIREALVVEANEIAAEEGLQNLHYEFCNAMIWLGKLLENIPVGALQAVTIQFPDPWFKKRHAKRRMVNSELVGSVVNKLASGGQVYVHTDIEFLSDEMFKLFRADNRLWNGSATKILFR